MNDVIRSLRDGWGEFWAISWWAKGPVLGVVAVLLVVVISVAAATSDENVDVGRAVSEAILQTPTSEPTVVKTVIPAPSPRIVVTREPAPSPAVVVPSPTVIIEEAAPPPPAAAGSSGGRSLEIVSSITRTDSIGSLYVEGEVRNNAAYSCEFVEVIVTLRDAGGTFVRSESGYAQFDVVPAGGVAPFKVLFIDAPQFSTYELSAEGSVAGDILADC